MTRTQSATAYTQRTDAELRRFVSDRGLGTGDAPRRSLIRALRDADKDATFRFLDLSPELRNLVYENLLTIRYKQGWQGRQYCYPNILRASKQTHAEGTGILYNNEEPIIIKLEDCGWDDHINISVGNRIVGSESTWMLSDATVEWPSFILKVRKLHLVVHCDTQASMWRRNVNIQINHALYDLSQFLVSRSEPANGKIVIHEKGLQNLDQLFPVLVPIAYLNGVMELETHHLPNATETIRSKMDALEISSNDEDLLRKLCKLEGQVKERLERVNEAEVRDVLLIQQLQHARGRLDLALKNSGYYTVAHHEGLKTTLASVERGLRESRRWKEFEGAEERTKRNAKRQASKKVREQAREKRSRNEKRPAGYMAKKQRGGNWGKALKQGPRNNMSKLGEDSSGSESEI